MGWRLSTYVHAVERDTDGQLTGRSALFGPADDLPDWAVAAISNPDVWAERGDSAPAPASRPAKPAESSTPAGDGPPPKGGAGSGVAEWRAYAARKNVEVPEDANRDQVIAALTEAKVRTE